MAERILTERHTFGPVAFAAEVPFSRADLEVYGINHFRPSFVVHTLFNDPDVDVDALRGDEVMQRTGYAGRFAVFGHQRCMGDEGHCNVPTGTRRFDDRPSHPLTRAFRRVVVTDALRRVLAAGDAVTVTLLVAAAAVEGVEFEGNLFDAGGLQIATFA